MAKALQESIRCGKTLKRSGTISQSSLDKQKRTVNVIFSTETPVKRSFGMEILDHSPGACDLTRMKAGAAVLLEHDTSMACGITESADIINRTGRAEVRFSRTAIGDQAMMEVEDGTLRWLSVGYRVDQFQETVPDEEFRAVSWQPMEISFVRIPADENCGVRSHPDEEKDIPVMRLTRALLDEDANVGGSPPAAPQALIPQDIVETELDRVRGISVATMHWSSRIPNLKADAEKAIKDKTTLARFQETILEKLKVTDASRLAGAGQPAGASHMLGRSIGEIFTDSETYREWQRSGGSMGKLRTSVEIKDRCRFDVRASNPLNATTESLTSIQKLPGVVQLDQQMAMIADLFSQGVTDGLTVRYIQEDAFTNSATAVAEGASKPAATLDISEVDATVRKIAVYTKTTLEMVADFPQVQSYINGRLGYMVQILEDNHLLNGTGNTNQIKGILLFTGLQTVAAGASPTPADALFKAISYIRGANNAGFVEPDAMVVNPTDWMNLKLTKDASGQYLGGGPFSGQYGVGGYSNFGIMWGLPAVVTVSIAQGTALVGAFRYGAQIFRRMGLTIDTTNNDQDDFIKNLITVRAEERLALACYRPAAFCTVTGIPAT